MPIFAESQRIKMINQNQLSDFCKAGIQKQESIIRTTMWNDIETLKSDVIKLREAINYLHDFLKKAFP